MKLNIKLERKPSLQEWCKLLPRLQRYTMNNELVPGAVVPGAEDWRVVMEPSRRGLADSNSYHLSKMNFGESSFGVIRLDIEILPETKALGDVWIVGFGEVKIPITPWKIPEVTEIAEDFREYSIREIQTSGWVVKSGSTLYSHNVLALPHHKLNAAPGWLQKWASLLPPDFAGSPVVRGPQISYLRTDAPARKINGRIHFLDVTFTNRHGVQSVSISQTGSPKVGYPAQNCDVRFRRFVLRVN